MAPKKAKKKKKPGGGGAISFDDPEDGDAPVPCPKVKDTQATARADRPCKAASQPNARPAPKTTLAALEALGSSGPTQSPVPAGDVKVRNFDSAAGATFLRSAVAIPTDERSVQLSIATMKRLSLHSGSVVVMTCKDKRIAPQIVSV